MDESEGTHGPVDEEVIASLFEKHHGSGVYELRTSTLPDWYTRGFQYFYLIYEGKILSVIGYSDWGDYVVLGGGKTHNPWKKKSNYFGSPIEKVIMARQPYIRGKPAIAGFSNFPGWQERMEKAGWKMKPIDDYGIDPKMVDNFRDYYGSDSEKTWGIRISDYDIENMVKAYEDFDSSWWNVLKNLDRYGEPRMKTESSQTSRTTNEGIRTKLGTTPLTMGDEDDCCEKLRDEVLGIMREWVELGDESTREWDEDQYNNMERAFDSAQTSCDEIVEYLEFSLKYDIGVEEHEYTHMLISKNEMKEAINNYYKCSFGSERYVV